jgi:hypothetical protein
VQSKWNEVKTLVPQRDQTLQDELKKQQNNEALRRQFAEKSNQVLHRDGRDGEGWDGGGWDGEGWDEEGWDEEGWDEEG